MNVEEALHTLTSGQIASISIENVFIKLQPPRTRFQPMKPRVVVTFSIFYKVIVSKMIYVGLFLHQCFLVEFGSVVNFAANKRRK